MTRNRSSRSRTLVGTTRVTAKRDHEAGDTLLEVLLAIVVLAIASLAILLAFSTSIIGSSEYRSLATLDTVLRTAAEQATTQIQQEPSAAWACPSTDASSVTFTLPTGYTATIPVANVQYWNAAASGFTPTCVANSAQLITINVVYSNTTYQISFVVDDSQQRPLNAAGAAAKLAFIGQPGSTTGGYPISPPPIVAVEDTAGNIVTTDLSQVNLAIKTGSGTVGATLSSNCFGAEFYGVVTFSNCSINTVGSNYALVASETGLTPATSNFFNILPPPASQLTFSLVPSGSAPAAVTATSGPYQIQEQDLYGNPVSAVAPVTVNLGTSSSGAAGDTPFFSATAGGTAATAITSVTIPMGATTSPSFYYSDTAAGTPTITGTNATLIDATTIPTIGPGAATSLLYTGPPPAATNTGTRFTVTVAEVDQFGNTVTTDSTSTVTITANGSGFTCSRTANRVVNGVATFTNCGYPNSGTYVLTATDGTLTPAAATTAVIGPASKLVYTTPPPSSTGAGAPFTVVVAEEDSSGNIEAGDSTTGLSLAANHGGGGFSCTTTPTRVTNGVATYTGCTYTIASATPYTLTASSGFLTQATANTTVVSIPSKLVFTTPPPASTSAGSTFTVVVSEEDAFGNVTTSDSTTALTLGASGGTFACTVTPTKVTNGVATYTGCSYAVASGSAYTLTASSGTLTPATATTVVTGAPSKLVYTTPPPASVGAGTTFTVVVAEEDTFNNVETTDSTTALTLAASGGNFTCTTTPTKVTNGVATYAGCSYTIASATGYTLTASSGTLAHAVATTTVGAGTATKLLYTTTPPPTTTAGATFSVVVTEEDAFGNVETGDSTTDVTLAANHGGGGFAAPRPRRT